MEREIQDSKDSRIIIVKSNLPAYIESANKIYNREYASAIEDLKKQLLNTNSTDFKTLSMIHINLMEAYFKCRYINPNFSDLFMFHAKEALKNGHNTGLAPYRLIVGLEKQKRFREAIEVCKIVTDKDYAFSIHGYKQKPEFIERLKKLELKSEKINESCEEPFITEQEKEMIIKNSERN